MGHDRAGRGRRSMPRRMSPPNSADRRRAACPARRARTRPASAGSGNSTTIWCMGRTRIQRPGGDAAVVGLPDSEPRIGRHDRLCTPRYCLADPVAGRPPGGGRSLAQPDRGRRHAAGGHQQSEFRQPERPPIMGQLVGCVTGMGEACSALDFPVVSGNVSLYNETSGEAILPTPVIGGVGVIDQAAPRPSTAARLPAPTTAIVLIGSTRRVISAIVAIPAGSCLDRSPMARHLPVDLAVERRNGDFVRDQIVTPVALQRVPRSLRRRPGARRLAEMVLAGKAGLALDAPLGSDMPPACLVLRRGSGAAI